MRRGLLIAGLFLIAAASRPMRSQVTQHIEVVVSPQSENPSPEVLKKSSFQLRLQGNVVPLTLTGARSYPQSLLILAAAPGSVCTPSKSALLQSLTAKGWAIRIGPADGTIGAPLEDGQPWQTVCSPARSPSPQPTTGLQAMPGRRVVIFESGAIPAVLATTRKAIPEVYNVGEFTQPATQSPIVSTTRYGTHGSIASHDPSLPGNTSSEDCYSVGSIVSANDPCAADFGAGKPSPFGPRMGVLYEKSLVDALKELLHAQGRYYDLSFHLPAPSSPQRRLAQLDLRLHTAQQLHGALNLYTETAADPAASPVRVAAAGYLLRVQRQ